MSQTIKEISITITSKMDNLPTVSSESCIYRVPEKYLRAKEEAYTPHIISIGPFHRNNKRLHSAEEIKLRYLKSFLTRIKADLLSCTRMVKESEEQIRECYQEIITLSSNEFVEMILVDAAFIVELFIRNHFKELRDEHDAIFDKQWMSDGVFHDLLLLENQLPFFILEKLFDNALMKSPVTFFKLTFEYFKDILRAHELVNTRIQVRHLVDYVRALQLPSFARGVTKSRGIAKFETTRSATELMEAGVRFKRGEGICSVLDIIFRDGVLQMPHFVVHEWSEPYYRNMIAYEQCHHDDKYISSYIVLMDSLINTQRDVQILIQSGILENQLGSDDDLATLFNTLFKETLRESSQFYYSKLCENLNAYSRTRWHQWKAAWHRHKMILGREYFSNPWSGISVVAAVILLILTIVQTACSLVDTYAGDARKLFRRGHNS
ncbi:UPF0481 protein At3g47200-like [Punica granatum]|uniref:Uncharacterized protein n=2 Tax=Punica granatum TaxID=22663 RepID=A0A218W1D4_PUNGR|nr:UPF0481 protein At3g47200-like [Punica granatum]OWM66120.1 hypothetical protein CDL15_Pgr015547 [Punica granatum]PKI49064.1 hypothetical protein CRG98_030516 [Punica granatum]